MCWQSICELCERAVSGQRTDGDIQGGRAGLLLEVQQEQHGSIAVCRAGTCLSPQDAKLEVIQGMENCMPCPGRGLVYMILRASADTVRMPTNTHFGHLLQQNWYPWKHTNPTATQTQASLGNSVTSRSQTPFPPKSQSICFCIVSKYHMCRLLIGLLHEVASVKH